MAMLEVKGKREGEIRENLTLDIWDLYERENGNVDRTSHQQGPRSGNNKAARQLLVSTDPTHQHHQQSRQGLVWVG